MSSLRRIASNCSRSSAESIDSGEVPQMRVPVAWPAGDASQRSSGIANFKGVWPPNCTITPSGRSASITLSTSSKVSGSK